MSSQRRPVEIFSFSFLDVIACGVGVVLFITILSVFLTVSSVSPELVDELRAGLSDLETIERMEKEQTEAAQKAATYRELKKRESELENLTAALSASGAEAQEYAKLTGEIQWLQIQAPGMETIARVLERRKPVARSTSKLDAVFLAFPGGDQLRIVRRESKSDFASNHYNVTNTADSTLLRARTSVSLSDTLKKGGELQATLADLDPTLHYVECYVESDAFEDYVRTREALIPYGWDLGFRFMEDTDTLFYSYGGSRTKIQ